jgi:hypothetical protein
MVMGVLLGRVGSEGTVAGGLRAEVTLLASRSEDGDLARGGS